MRPESPNPDESHVFLAVTEFGDEAVVTSLLGFAPTSVWLKGDSVPDRPTARRTHSRWSFHSPLPLHAHVEAHLEALLTLLEPHATRIRHCATQFRTELRCAIYYTDFSPGIHLSELLLERIARMGVPLDFDLYFLGEDVETQP
jgi:hypothetical protein